MRSSKEWKKNQINRSQFNDEIYAVIEQALVPYKTAPPHERYNDARLVPREILDNVYQYNKPVLIIGLQVEVGDNHLVKIRMYHDGDHYDPFAEANPCVLLKQLNYQYKFEAKFVASDSGRFRLDLTFDLSEIAGAKNGKV